MASQRRDPAAAKIAVRPTPGGEKPVRRTFPGPRAAEARLRVAIDRPAFAELNAHAKESLEAEVCGVLVGQICVDDEGRFVHVEAVIRGSAAAQKATSVTFTQATWEAIHETLEREHAQRRIVGWYHTHPGFGVEFSEMDLFIQRNFFPAAEQIALVTDPMNGAVAIASNAAEGVEYLPRFWVDAREQPAKVPEGSAKAPLGAGGAPATKTTTAGGETDLASSIKALEARVGQLLQAHDEHRQSYHRLLFTVGFAVCAALMAAVGYLVYTNYTSRLQPPRINSFVPVPVQIGDKTVLLGVGVAEWDVPPELNALLLQAAKREREEAEAKTRAEAEGKATKDGKAEAPPAGAQPAPEARKKS